MNFFGHAAAASWRSREPAFVLGSMLPDFATMIGARPPLTKHDALAAGVRFHHATDEVFHELSAFRSLVSRAFLDLSALGLDRGPARAAAHIGVEILLDGVLALDPEARAAYREALSARAGLGSELGWRSETSELGWRSEGEAGAFEGLLSALERRGLHEEHTAPAALALRVGRALSTRPRLAIDRGGERIVRGWAQSARASVRERAGEIIRGLQSRL